MVGDTEYEAMDMLQDDEAISHANIDLIRSTTHA